MKNIFNSLLHSVTSASESNLDIRSISVKREMIQELTKSELSAVAGGPQVDNDPES